jgi:hypothetical protein
MALTITINNLSPALEKKAQEVIVMHQYVEQAMQALRGAGGAQTSGNILAPGATTVVGSWTYTPQATS